MIKKIRIIALLISLSCFSVSVSAGSWKVFIYMDSGEGLSDMAIKNITDMLHAQPNDTIDFAIQLHAYDFTALRYQLKNNKLIFIEEVALTGNSKQDLIDGCTWGFSNTQADHTLFIGWGHGWGILDPEWNPETREWEVDGGSLSNECEIKSIRSKAHNHKKNHKGFIFNDNAHSYLTNQDLIESLKFVKENLLHDKKIDIVAFDTCMGAMLEVAYQITPYARYLVGNQSCSLRDGFNYQGIIAELNQQHAPHEIARGMVRAFDGYYREHDDSGIYTHGALDLSHVHGVKNALDAVIKLLLDNPDYSTAVLQARQASPRFCLFPMYTDLIAFCKNIELELSLLEQTPEVCELKDALQPLYAVTDEFVIARCGGATTQGLAHGFAIYLPLNIIDSSYRNTLFAHESLWTRLLDSRN